MRNLLPTAWRSAKVDHAIPARSRADGDTGVRREANRSFRSMIPSAILLCLTIPFTAFFPSFWRGAFCAPTAWLAASFLHAPWMPTEDGYLIALPGLSLQVTLACSGAQFFCLLWSLMAAVCTAGRMRMRFWERLFGLTGVAVLAYALTLLANSARVVAGWWTALWARHVLPDNFQAGIHLITGIVVFTCFLVAGYALAVWLADQEGRRRSGQSPTLQNSDWRDDLRVVRAVVQPDQPPPTT